VLATGILCFLFPSLSPSLSFLTSRFFLPATLLFSPLVEGFLPSPFPFSSSSRFAHIYQTLVVLCSLGLTCGDFFSKGDLGGEDPGRGGGGRRESLVAQGSDPLPVSPQPCPCCSSLPLNLGDSFLECFSTWVFPFRLFLVPVSHSGLDC